MARSLYDAYNAGFEDGMKCAEYEQLEMRSELTAYEFCCRFKFDCETTVWDWGREGVPDARSHSVGWYGNAQIFTEESNVLEVVDFDYVRNGVGRQLPVLGVKMGNAWPYDDRAWLKKAFKDEFEEYAGMGLRDGNMAVTADGYRIYFDIFGGTAWTLWGIYVENDQGLVRFNLPRYL